MFCKIAPDFAALKITLCFAKAVFAKRQPVLGKIFAAADAGSGSVFGI